MNKQNPHHEHAAAERGQSHDQAQQKPPALGKLASQSTEGDAVSQETLGADEQTRGNQRPGPPPDITFASVLREPLAMPLELPPQALDEESEPTPPTRRRSRSDPSLLSIRDLGQTITVPLEVERDIVSRLPVDFQARGPSLATSAEPSGECDSIEDLLQRLGNLFPENRGANTNQENSGCCICKNKAIFYPYRLADCGHVACGRCIYTAGVAACGEAMRGTCKLCGQAIRNQPRPVDDFQLYHAQSRWTMASQDYTELLKQNEERVHRGSAGVFGGENREQDQLFRGVGYSGAFDRLPQLDITSDSPSISLPQTALRLTHCPAHHNYSPFPLVEFSHLRTPSKLIQFFQAMKYLYREDVFLLEEDDESHYLLRPERFTVRLIGWEHLAVVESDSGSSSKGSSGKRKRKEETIPLITWKRGGGNESTPDPT